MINPVSFSVQNSPVIPRTPLETFARQFFTYLIFPIALVEWGLKQLLLPARTSQSINRLDHLRASFFHQIHEGLTRTTLETLDKVKLDTVQIRNPASQKWIVYLNPNNGCYENNLPYLHRLSQATGQSVYAGNYRGTGRSEGDIVNLKDLLLDGDAFIQHLLSQGVPPQHITLHGHSMGGGVATELAALHPGIKLVADRTYSSISDAIIELGSSISRPLAKVVAFLARHLGWNLDPFTAFPKITGHKVTIHHSQCFLQPCGLYTKLKHSGARPLQPIKIRTPAPSEEEAHCNPLEGIALHNYVVFVNQ